jgi:aryl-alcohol dehydrogenase-like predicted oxidoreductase
MSSHGITQIDTAAAYPPFKPDSLEQILGDYRGPERFAINTKVFLNDIRTENMREGGLSLAQV